jgi:hypothetical protein
MDVFVDGLLAGGIFSAGSLAWLELPRLSEPRSCQCTPYFIWILRYRDGKFS